MRSARERSIVAEAAASVASTLETAARGVIYEHVPQSLPSQRLAADMRAMLTQIREQGATVYDAEVAVVVSLRAEAGTLHLDFAGTSPRVRGNVNCPIAVTRAAAVFVLRTLLDDDVPTNAGIARAIEIVTPDDCAVAARWPSAWRPSG